jgi:cyanophycin synthetase
MAAALREQIAAETNPGLLALQAAAAKHDVAFLWDDDAVSVGLGSGSQSWPTDALPHSSDLVWSERFDVPVGLVTGTNGKTTTVRLCKHILMQSGRHVGMSSTEWIAVNERIIERGDWSGPGGARAVLRDREVDVAVLETARGGLLRRGLGVTRANAALISNVAADHLGDFGSQNLHELLNIKWVVSRAVARRGVLILNADDPLLVGKSAEFAGTLVWFSTDAKNALVNLHTDAGGTAYVQDNGDLFRLQGSAAERLCSAADVPITLGGAARHNIANALAAAALTHALGADIAAISAGLTSMSQSENPGRSNVYDIRGFKVLVDFAHNPHAMEAVFEMARALPAKRRLLAFCQAGDRTDELIRELARSAWKIGLDAVNVAELAASARGRRQGEVYAIIGDELLCCGARPAQIRHFMEEHESLDAALAWARDGDLVIMLALGGSRPIIERLEALRGQAPGEK